MNIELEHALGILIALIIVINHKLPLASSWLQLSLLCILYTIALLSFRDNLPLIIMFTLFFMHIIMNFKIQSSLQVKTDEL